MVVGAGSGGLSVASQIHNMFKAAGKPLKDGDIAIVDPAKYHYYQPGWSEFARNRISSAVNSTSRTLVGAGLKNKITTKKVLASPIPSYFSHIFESAKVLSPSTSSITTSSGRTITCDSLVIATGLQINSNGISGLSKVIADPTSGVSSIYSYDTADKVWSYIQVWKCHIHTTCRCYQMSWRTSENHVDGLGSLQMKRRGDDIKTTIFTGVPIMFSVQKYSEALNNIRIRRGIGGHFVHNLISINQSARKATFQKVTVDANYDFLHLTPPMGPLDLMKGQPVSDEVGWVNVDTETLRHVKFENVWALGDCTNLPTAKTAGHLL